MGGRCILLGWLLRLLRRFRLVGRRLGVAIGSIRGCLLESDECCASSGRRSLLRLSGPPLTPLRAGSTCSLFDLARLDLLACRSCICSCRLLHRLLRWPERPCRPLLRLRALLRWYGLLSRRLRRSC